MDRDKAIVSFQVISSLKVTELASGRRGWLCFVTQSSFRNFSFIPWSPPAPSTVVCSELQPHRDVLSTRSHWLQYKITGIEEIILNSTQQSRAFVVYQTPQVEDMEVNPAKQTTRTWILQVPTMNSFLVMLTILGILPCLLHSPSFLRPVYFLITLFICLQKWFSSSFSALSPILFRHFTEGVGWSFENVYLFFNSGLKFFLLGFSPVWFFSLQLHIHLNVLPIMRRTA